MKYTREEALAGAGGPKLQRLVRAVVNYEQQHVRYNADYDWQFREAMERELSGEPSPKPPTLQRRATTNAAAKSRLIAAERELEMSKQDLALIENRERKYELQERWKRKDPWAAFPLYRDPALYPQRAVEESREKDPWVSYRL